MIGLSVETMANGALIERIQEEIGKAIANIVDPNTPTKKARTVTMKMTIKPNEQRNMAEVSVTTSSTLCSPVPVEAGRYIAVNSKTGEVEANEFKSDDNFVHENDNHANVITFNK